MLDYQEQVEWRQVVSLDRVVKGRNITIKCLIQLTIEFRPL
jgi:hypothetical protein